MRNPFVRLIAEERIRTLADLKATYHTLVMKTHPDAVGSDRLQKEFIELSDYYEEARSYITQVAKEASPDSLNVQNHRLEFYRQLHLIESLAMPYAYHAKENKSRLGSARELAIGEMSAWKPDVVDLFMQRAGNTLC